MGPYPADNRGNQYIIVIIDNCTRVVELGAHPTSEADNAARALQAWCSRYEVPIKVLSDNGTQYVNKVIEELMLILNAQHQLITPYSHEENSLVERANKEVLRHLRAFIYEINSSHKWSDFLPMVQRIINTTPHSVLGCSPYDLIHGYLASHRKKMIAESTEIEQPIHVTDHMAEMVSTQQRLLTIALARQLAKDTKHLAKQQEITRQGTKLKVVEFPVGSFVLVRYPDEKLGARPPNKLHTILEGPMRVIGSRGNEYKLLNLVTNKTEKLVHISRLEPFEYDHERVDPKQVALRDREDSFITEVLEHAGDPKSKMDMDFLVKWDDGSTPLWIPWKELRNNSILHEYLRANKLSRLIPISYKHNIEGQRENHSVYNIDDDTTKHSSDSKRKRRKFIKSVKK